MRESERRRARERELVAQAAEEARAAAAPRKLSARSEGLARHRRQRQLTERLEAMGVGATVPRSRFAQVMAELNLLRADRSQHDRHVLSHVWSALIDCCGDPPTHEEPSDGAADAVADVSPRAVRCDDAIDTPTLVALLTAADEQREATAASGVPADALVLRLRSLAGQPVGHVRQSVLEAAEAHRGDYCPFAPSLVATQRHRPRGEPRGERHGPPTDAARALKSHDDAAAEEGDGAATEVAADGAASREPSGTLSKRNASIFVSLYAVADDFRHHRELLRAQRAQAAMAGCTFEPDLSDSTRTHAHARAHGSAEARGEGTARR